MSLMEVFIGMAIATLILAGLWAIQKNFTSSNTFLEKSLRAQEEVRRTFKMMVTEIRSASGSNTGTYAVEQASSTSFIFYGDIDDDVLKERVHYYLDGTTLKKGVVKPTGTPLSYNLASESVSEVLHNIDNGIVPLFSFYDISYAGTSSPLVEPVNIASIRLVKITAKSDEDAAKPPGPITFTTQVTIRNLKDNL